MYYGQCGEDEIVHERYFKNKRNGVFLELGALDGVKYSNTKFFEDTLGWTGVLIEPLSDQFEKCKVNRPKSKIYNYIASNSEGSKNLYQNDATSSVTDHTSSRHFDKFHKHKNINVLSIECKKLGDILHDAGITYIDFWSLDVEGAEYDVLQSMDWNIPVGVICIESFPEEEELNNKCRQILRKNGFIYDGRVAHNELWINPSQKRRNLVITALKF